MMLHFFYQLSIMFLIKHITMFRLKEECTESDFQTVCDGLLMLPNEIPSIVRYELGRDLLLESGQTHPAGKNRQIAWSAYFKSIEDYEAYAVHAAHVHFLKNVLGPVIEPGSRAAIQYQVEEE